MSDGRDKKSREAERLLREAGRRDRERQMKDSCACNIISVIGREMDETHVHSRIIYHLLNRNPYNQNNAYLKQFLRIIKIPQRYLGGPWTVHREKTFAGDRVDFIMESDQFLAVLEMKLEAEDGPKQLERYDQLAKKRGKPYRIYYLTLYGDLPSKQSMGKMDQGRLYPISFRREMIQWLENCMQMTEQDSYSYSFLKQYLGTIRQITGMDEETVDMADLIVSLETGKAAKLVIEAFNSRMEEVKEDFFAGIGSVIKRKCKLKTQPYSDGVKTVLDTALNKKAACQFILWVSAIGDVHPYACLGFSSDTESVDFMELDDVRKRFPALYRKWTGRLEGLSLNKTLRRAKRTRWFYLENTRGELLDFRAYNDAALELIDEGERNIQCRFIGGYLAEQALRPLLISE